MTRVEWTKHALKQLKSIPGNYQKAISEKISLLQRYPALVANLDIKKMAGGEGEFGCVSEITGSFTESKTVSRL